MTGGVFHSKISVLTADDECHLLIGSGNLTFGGWCHGLDVDQIDRDPGSAIRQSCEDLLAVLPDAEGDEQ